MPFILQLDLNGVVQSYETQMHGLYPQRGLSVFWKLAASYASLRSVFDWNWPRHCCPRDYYFYTRLLQLCKSSKFCLKAAHAQIIVDGHEQNQFVATKLVGKYAELGGLGMIEARNVFDRSSERDVFLWNVMIQGYLNSGVSVDEAVALYDEMRRRGVSANGHTFPYVLKACGALRDGRKGQAVHGTAVRFGYDHDLFVGNALVAFYSKTKDVVAARKVFDEIPQRDVVTWNSMISGYSSNGQADEALELFRALVQDDASSRPDNATLVGVLPACVQAAAIQEGMWIHCYIIKSGMEVDAALGSGLLSMYSNSGRLNRARDVFDRIANKNIVVWNAMIKCYGLHGQADEALYLFSELLKTGVHPDSVLFLCLLSTCSHAGMVVKGRELFEMMVEYGVNRSDQHYACMVDLLGRAGLLDEAVQFMKTMPLQAGRDAYGALLGACRIHNRLELAEEVVEKLFLLDSDNAGRYVILAKMYEDAGKRGDAARLRKILREKNIRRPLGCSSVEVDGILQTFGVDDGSHPLKEHVFDMLERLNSAVDEELLMV